LHPVTSRIHIGTDNDPTPQATQAAKNLGPAESSREVAAETVEAETAP
jgi:hypothetical protein